MQPVGAFLDAEDSTGCAARQEEHLARADLLCSLEAGSSTHDTPSLLVPRMAAAPAGSITTSGREVTDGFRVADNLDRRSATVRSVGADCRVRRPGRRGWQRFPAPTEEHGRAKHHSREEAVVCPSGTLDL